MTYSTWIYGVLAGVLFFPWPICLRQSGVAPNLGATLFQLVSLIAITIATTTAQGTDAFRPVASMAFRSWALIVFSAVCGGLGIFFFNRGASTIPKESIPIMAVTMIVTQVVCQGIYAAVVENKIAPEKIFALGLICLGVYLFSR